MKIRIRKVQKEYTMCDGGIDTYWIIEMKRWWWPFWRTLEDFGDDELSAKYYLSYYKKVCY